MAGYVIIACHLDRERMLDGLTYVEPSDQYDTAPRRRFASAPKAEEYRSLPASVLWPTAEYRVVPRRTQGATNAYVARLIRAPIPTS